MADLFDLLMAEELSPAEMPLPRPPAALVEPAAASMPALAKIEPSEAISGPAVEFNNPELRQYQRDVIAQFWERIEAGNRKVMLVLPTGAGKTHLSVEIIDQCVQKGMKVLFLAHRRELVNQASRTLHKGHLSHGIIQAGFTSRLYESIQVASVQTVHARAVRHSVIEMPEFGVVVVDECHRIRGQSYQQIIAQFPNAIVIGLTATPCRGDGKGLGAVFDYMVVGPDVEDLVKDGHLVGSRVYAPSRPDLKGVKVARGDYAEDQLAARMNTAQLVGDVILHWQRLAQGKQTIVFASSVAHSVHLCDEFRKANVLAEHIDGTTPGEERDSILKRLASGEIDVVVNCQVLTEGFDCPNIGCIVLARPTKSVGLFRQMVGRGLRPAPGKTELLLLDHAGAVFEHGFIDERMTWALREDDQAVNHRQKARQAGSVPKLVACPECSAINWQGRPCSACGWRPRIKGAGMEMGEGELGEVDRTTRTVKTRKQIKWDMKEFYGMLKHVAESRGYKPGWAYHKFRVKFPANAPGRDWPSIEPNAELMSWIRSQQIKWAKSRNNV